MTGGNGAREEVLRAFLAEAGWGDAIATPLAGDASTRRYLRVRANGRTAMLMDQPQNAETPAAPADAGAEERRKLGYNAVARLAGADCARFAAVADYLRGRGFAAPEILAADFNRGFLLLEDLGDNLYAEALAAGAGEAELYAAAVDALADLHRLPAPQWLNAARNLPVYDETALLAETALLTEWFLPMALERKADKDEAAEHEMLWRQALAPFRDAPHVFTHRDYHAQNLFWLDSRTGHGRVGMIDFQDAVAGAPAYDLVSLLEDARRDVAPELAEAMAARYLARSGTDAEAFLASAAVFAAQRNTKIAGIFARLAQRDK